MSNQKKRTPIGVFEVLKSIMDAKAKTLHETINIGKRAKTELPVLCERISNLQTFIWNSRYDPVEAREAEIELADNEYQLAGINKKIEKGGLAVADLVYVDKFNASYESVCNHVRNTSLIRDLRGQCRVIEDKMSQLEERIFACEVNMDADVRSPDVVAQAAADLEAYNRSYSEYNATLEALRAKISDLQK